jgi:hypothetical protein
LADILLNNGASDKDQSAAGTRGDLAIAEDLNQKETANDGSQTGGGARKRKANQHSSDAEESDEEDYENDHPCEAVHKRVKIGHGGIILKEKKRVKTVEFLDNDSSKREHCKIAKCTHCDEAYDLCFKEASCQYRPCKYNSHPLVRKFNPADVAPQGIWKSTSPIRDGLIMICTPKKTGNNLTMTRIATTTPTASAFHAVMADLGVKGTRLACTFQHRIMPSEAELFFPRTHEVVI